MAPRICSMTILAVAALAATPAIEPALAQTDNPIADFLGSIFGNPPPRPPADVRGAPPSRQQPAPYYPSGRDAAPSQPLPSPMNLPPSNRPGVGGVQSQELPPPTGGVVVPALPPGPDSPRNAPQPTNTAPQPSDAVVVEPPAQRITNPTTVFAGLDKITGRIISFDVAVNETVQFGALQVTPRACYSRPPTETP